MPTTSTKKLDSWLKITAILLAAVLTTGCMSAKSKPTEEAEPAAPPPAPAPVEPEPPAPEPEPEPAPEPEPVMEQLTSWTVVAGNNLWAISGHEEVYDLPEQWPLIYKANLDQITDADLIYPGQVLTIPRDMSQDDIDGAIHHARNRGAWSLGPVEDSDLNYIQN